MVAISPSQRVGLSPAVRAILETDSPKSAFLKQFVRYKVSLLAHDPAGLDITIAPDVRCHALEVMGFPPGRDEPYSWYLRSWCW